jgi:hypothetical protein
VSQLPKKYGSLDTSQPYDPPGPVTGITLPFYPIVSSSGSEIMYLFTYIHFQNVVIKEIWM